MQVGPALSEFALLLGLAGAIHLAFGLRLCELHDHSTICGHVACSATSVSVPEPSGLQSGRSTKHAQRAPWRTLLPAAADGPRKIRSTTAAPSTYNLIVIICS